MTTNQKGTNDSDGHGTANGDGAATAPSVTYCQGRKANGERCEAPVRAGRRL